MSSKKAQHQAMLFNYGTTYKTDYHGERAPKASRLPVTINLTRPQQPEPVTEILKDVHTMGQWKKRVPFSLWHRPKEIIRTDPYQHLNPYVFTIPSQEEDRKKAQQTRPRLLITPAGALDDLDDEKRQKMIKQIYISTTEECLRSAVPENPIYLCPLPGTLAPSRPFKLSPLHVPYVSPEWRWESMTWDRRQLRSEVTKSFWDSRPAPKCRACDTTAMVAELRKTENMLQRFSEGSERCQKL